MVDRADSVALAVTFQQLRLDDVEALAVGWGQHDWLAGRKWRTHGGALRWLTFGKYRDLYSRTFVRRYGLIPQNLQLNRFAADVKRQRWPNGEFLGAFHGAPGDRLHER